MDNPLELSVSCSAVMLRTASSATPTLIFWHPDPFYLREVTEGFMKHGAQLMSTREALSATPSPGNFAYVSKEDVNIHLGSAKEPVEMETKIELSGEEWLSACHDAKCLTILLCPGDFESVKATLLNHFHDVLGMSVEVRTR